ncbi:hypothetical protein G6F68_013143 [Rhizopus microsporus]|nr:hypothetical protein G6F68_013143 [Rhizopus microsporus]
MAEVVAGNGRRRQHREALGQFHAGVRFGLQQVEQPALLAVLGAGRIAGRRTDAAVLLVDQGFVVQRLGVVVSPESGTHALMQALGQRLGEAVGERLQKDRVVVVMLGLEARDVRVDADTGGDRERADPVLLAAVGRGNEIGQAEVRALGRLVHLLAQEVQRGFALRVLHAHVVADAVGRPQPEHRLGGQPLLIDDAGEHRAGGLVQVAGLGADELP